ncbi:hypothetical protein ACA910_007057 [Epithemia clementina (nom. ined.)]
MMVPEIHETKSIRSSSTTSWLVNVRNLVAAVVLVVGASHLLSSSIVHQPTRSSRRQLASKKSVVDAEQPLSLNSRRALETATTPETIASRIGSITTTSTPPSSSWHNDYNLVHVVNTRFLQHQPRLLHLAKARLELFQTFPLPSMRQQSNQQFLWIIWTDPNLDFNLRQALLQLVADWPQVLVVASYHNEQARNLRTLYGFETVEAMRPHIWYGNVDLLTSYFEASQSHVLVETDLDADDALAQTFVETAQAQAATSVGHDFRPAATHSETYCPEYHAEWRFFADDNNHDTNDNHNAPEGQLVHYHNQNFCIKSGLTIAYHVQAQARRLSLCNHHEDGMCCPADMPQPPADMGYPATPDFSRRQLAATAAAVNNHSNSNNNHHQDDEDGLEVIPIWQNKYPDLVEGGDILNTLNFFETHRHLMGQIDNKYFFNQESLWKAAVKGCCLAFENFDDTDFVPGLNLTSTHNGHVEAAISKWFDVLAFSWKTTITFEKGMHAMGGYFNLVDVGGPGAGIRVYLDVMMDNQDAVHIIGQTRGFFGFVSTNKVYTVEMTVGPDGYYQNMPTRSEAFTIDWLILAFPPYEPCRRQLRALPATWDETEPDMQALQAAVFMARTPTAAGMKHVLPASSSSSSEQKNKKGDSDAKNSMVLSTYETTNNDQVWEYLQSTFGITPSSVAQVHNALEQDMEQILLDAFAGQCTPGHSCKSSTKRALGYLLDQQRSKNHGSS